MPRSWMPRKPSWRFRKTFPRKSIHTEISPLRCAPVEMTKGRAVLPEREVAEQKPLFVAPDERKGPEWE